MLAFGKHVADFYKHTERRLRRKDSITFEMLAPPARDKEPAAVSTPTTTKPMKTIYLQPIYAATFPSQRSQRPLSTIEEVESRPNSPEVMQVVKSDAATFEPRAVQVRHMPEMVQRVKSDVALFLPRAVQELDVPSTSELDLEPFEYSMYLNDMAQERLDESPAGIMDDEKHFPHNEAGLSHSRRSATDLAEAAIVDDSAMTWYGEASDDNESAGGKHTFALAQGAAVLRLDEAHH